MQGNRYLRLLGTPAVRLLPVMTLLLSLGSLQEAAGQSEQEVPEVNAHQPTWAPEVALSEQHAATCLVGVGDRFPSLVLADLEGSQVELASLYGEKATLVVFWNSQYPYAQEQWERIPRDLAGLLGEAGLAVVGVAVEGDLATLRADPLGEREGMPLLHDAQGEALAAVATTGLPRTYLLNSQGEIVWHDLEYSRSMVRQMQNALRHTLSEE